MNTWIRHPPILAFRAFLYKSWHWLHLLCYFYFAIFLFFINVPISTNLVLRRAMIWCRFPYNIFILGHVYFFVLTITFGIHFYYGIFMLWSCTFCVLFVYFINVLFLYFIMYFLVLTSSSEELWLAVGSHVSSALLVYSLTSVRWEQFSSRMVPFLCKNMFSAWYKYMNLIPIILIYTVFKLCSSI